MRLVSDVHWDYFLLLEKDLIEIFDYVEPESSNFSTFGPNILKLFLSVCSEIDAVFKDLEKVVDPDCEALRGSRPNIDDHCKFVCEKVRARFNGAEVGYSGSSIKCEPWRSWFEDPPSEGEESDRGRNPQWWRAYNKVKHNRAEYYELANLGNLVDAFAGLLVASRALCAIEQPEEYMRPAQIAIFTKPGYGPNGIAHVEGGVLNVYVPRLRE